MNRLMAMVRAQAFGPARVAGVLLCGAALALGGAGHDARAQSGLGNLGNFGGLSNNSDAPIDISAEELEVFDKKRYAVLSGNVIVKQGPARMQTTRLVVYYGNTAGEGERQEIDRLEASGKVTIVSGKRKGVANQASYNARTQVVIMTGDVVLTDDKSVLTGERLELNLKTGIYRMKAKRSRVRLLFERSGNNEKN